MKIIQSTGDNELATVFIAENESGQAIEFLESTQPPIPRDKKWVLIISSLYGCPVRCPICDAGDEYKGKLTREELLYQIDYLIDRRFPDRNVPVDKLKIQFARMGEPAFNKNIIDALRELPNRYNAPGILPCISTIAPVKAEIFFDKLLNAKKELYDKAFQLQFSIHTTDKKIRNKLIPFPKWSFEQIAEYGRRFYSPSTRKITLNFAMMKNVPIDSKVLIDNFNPSVFLIKLTPLNPTYRAQSNNLESDLPETDFKRAKSLKDQLNNLGYDVLISIGEWEENKIGSNCGQYVSRYLKCRERLDNGYTCRVGNIDTVK